MVHIFQLIDFIETGWFFRSCHCGNGVATLYFSRFVCKRLFQVKEVLVNFKPIHLNLSRHRGELKNREEWGDRFDVLADCLVVFFVVALMGVFIFSFLIL